MNESWFWCAEHNRPERERMAFADKSVHTTSDAQRLHARRPLFGLPGGGR